MRLSDVRDLLVAEVCCQGDLSTVVEWVGAADLMSDVLAGSKPGMLLLTGLVSQQVVRTAVVADLCGVVLVRGKQPSADLVALAKTEGVVVLRTGLSMFEAAGLLYAAMRGEERWPPRSSKACMR
jgi:hypothetical protein